jgi:cell division protein FtsQ
VTRAPARPPRTTGRGATRGRPARRPSPPPSVVDARPRQRARRKAQRRDRWGRRLRRGGLYALGCLPLLLLGWLLLASPWLKVDEITVEGTTRLSPERVQLAVGVPDGTPLARVDTGAAERRVKRLPAVESVEVTRSWPATLVVTVRERHAVAGVLDAGSWTLVDADGVAFGTASALPQGAVRLQVRRPAADDPSTRAALAVLAELPAELRRRVVVVRAASDVAVSMQITGGRTVVWGAPGGAVDKSAAVLALLRRPGKVLDVSSPGVATTR